MNLTSVRNTNPNCVDINRFLDIWTFLDGAHGMRFTPKLTLKELRTVSRGKNDTFFLSGNCTRNIFPNTHRVFGSFEEGGCSPKFLIIDDGWQDVTNEFQKEGEPIVEGTQLSPHIFKILFYTTIGITCPNFFLV